MNIPSPLPGRPFSSTCATSLKEFEFSTTGNWNKGDHNFTNILRALHLTFKWRENYLSFIFISISRRPLLQNSKQFLPRNETSRANYLSSMRPCNILYFLHETTHICKYLKIHRLSWAIYILPLSIGLRQIDPFDRQYTVIILRSLSRSQCRRTNCY